MAAGIRTTTIDWSTTTISAASFLVHFGLLAAIYSDWCDPVVVDDEVARAGAEQALMALAPPPASEDEPAPVVEVPDPVPGTVSPPLRPSVPVYPGWGVGVGQLPVDQPTDPDWSDLDALTLTDPFNADVVKRAKAFRASLDATLRSYGSRTSGAESPHGWYDWVYGRGDNSAIATIESPWVTGGVSNAARVVAGMRGGFRNCYQRGLNETPDVTGSIRLTLRVDATGEVVEVTPVASGNLSEAVIRCVTAYAPRLFDEPEQGSAEIEVPVTFTRRRSAR